jgi:hypothetical protein
MARFRIRTLLPGSFHQGLGLLTTDSILETGETIQVQIDYGEKRRKEPYVVELMPHVDWQPLDDHAEALFAKFGIKPKFPRVAEEQEKPAELSTDQSIAEVELLLANMKAKREAGKTTVTPPPKHQAEPEKKQKRAADAA